MLPTFVLTSNSARFDGVTDPNVFFLSGIISDIAATVHNQVTALTKDPNSLVFVFGGASVVKQMLDANLLDVVRLFVTPDVLGAGVPLFDLTGDRTAESFIDPIKSALAHFTQVNERSFSSGLVEKIFARN